MGHFSHSMRCKGCMVVKHFVYLFFVNWGNKVKKNILPSNMVNLCRYWCLKEAFVKAMGTGVGYKLDDVEFHHMNWNNIFVEVAGKELKDWKFWLLDLGRNHSVSFTYPIASFLIYLQLSAGSSLWYNDILLYIICVLVKGHDLRRLWTSAKN